MKLLRAMAVALLLFAAGGVKAQDLATIVGTVTDDSGAAVPDAQVTISNSDRGFTRVVTSDSSGFYSLNRIPIGSYSITIEKPGFQRTVRTDINLNVGQTLRVDFQLKIGTVAEKVEVSGNPVAVETETSAISHVVTSTQVSELNLEASNFANLATLVPGAATLGSGFDPSSVGDLANSTISFNGLPVNSKLGSGWHQQYRSRLRQRLHDDLSQRRFHRRIPGFHIELQRGIWEVGRSTNRSGHQIRNQGFPRRPV